MMMHHCEIRVLGGMTLSTREGKGEAKRGPCPVAVLVVKVLAVVHRLHIETRIQAPLAEVLHRE
jgi:hypothetical protein